VRDYTKENKAWCYDNGVSSAKVESAWNNALENNSLVLQLSKSGITCWALAPHLFKQLIERY
jgi:hypothetical protein